MAVGALAGEPRAMVVADERAADAAGAGEAGISLAEVLAEAPLTLFRAITFGELLGTFGGASGASGVFPGRIRATN